MVTITFHDGINEIGRNKILIEDGAKVFLDFWKNYSREGTVITIFAPFAFFAVNFLCYPNRSPNTNTRGN